MAKAFKHQDALYRVAEIGQDGIAITNHFADEASAATFYDRRSKLQPITIVIMVKVSNETWKLRCSESFR